MCEAKVRGMILQGQKREREEARERERRSFRKMSCKVCGREDAKRCKGCGAVGYCGKACQGADWKVHRRECGMRYMSKTKREEMGVGRDLPYETV